MKALNIKEVLLSHLKFAAYLVVLVILTLFSIFAFMKTSEAEVSEIKLKSGDSEKIFAEQVDICASYQEILDIYHRFDTKEGEVNSEELKRAIAERKNRLALAIDQVQDKDVQVHKLMFSKIDGLMIQRDSITALRKEENAKRKALLDCNKEYRNKKKDIDLNKVNGRK